MEIPDFWKPHMVDRENRYVSNGEMFMKTVGPRLFPGFGGQLFTITNTGGTTTSTSLFHIGRVPDSIRCYFPDNVVITPQW